MDVVEVPAETVISGRSRDKYEVHGVLDRIQTLGLRVVSLEQTVGEGAEEPAEDLP